MIKYDIFVRYENVYIGSLTIRNIPIFFLGHFFGWHENKMLSVFPCTLLDEVYVIHMKHFNYKKCSLFCQESLVCQFMWCFDLFILSSDARRFSSLKIRASSDESSSSIQGDELLGDLKQKVKEIVLYWNQFLLYFFIKSL